MKRCLVASKYLVCFSLALLFLLNAIYISSTQIARVYAVTAYSDVIADLQSDENFTLSDYPAKTDDFSVSLEAIAESSEDELFVYCYIPYTAKSGLEATSINISTAINDSLKYKNYKLQLLSKAGTLSKYLVEDLSVKKDAVRYYDISSVFRKHYKDIDGIPTESNTISEKAFNVGRLYTASTLNDTVTYHCQETEVIEITDKFVGFVRYTNGFTLYPSSCDSHFVAFRTDRPIDKLLEADVYYTTQSYGWSMTSFVGERETFGDKAEEYVSLTYTQKVEHTGNGLFAPTYIWNRIESVDQFLTENESTQNVYSGAVIDVNVSNKITEEGKAALEKKDWVLRFKETSYALTGTSGATTETSTIVGDVTILRLTFETEGKIFNLGVIDNKQSGSRDPINDENHEVSANDEAMRRFLTLACGILFIVIFLYLVGFLFRKAR